ncbi:MAG: hypothetical protein MI748_14420 [Opitutales bacterium]|nr:hypothetical protein [Opitutales bacterium]
MPKVVIFGNSGSGKSTLANKYASLPEVKHLDLDTIAWKPDQPGVREELGNSLAKLELFISENQDWAIEGCYSSLISKAADYADELIFLNPGISACRENCKNRPWEPHKYGSKEEQDKNLDMLLSWVADYENRKDEFSLTAHLELFQKHEGKKVMIRSNAEAAAKSSQLNT